MNITNKFPDQDDGLFTLLSDVAKSCQSHQTLFSFFKGHKYLKVSRNLNGIGLTENKKEKADITQVTKFIINIIENKHFTYVNKAKILINFKIIKEDYNNSVSKSNPYLNQLKANIDLIEENTKLKSTINLLDEKIEENKSIISQLKGEAGAKSSEKTRLIHEMVIEIGKLVDERRNLTFLVQLMDDIIRA